MLLTFFAWSWFFSTWCKIRSTNWDLFCWSFLYFLFHFCVPVEVTTRWVYEIIVACNVFNMLRESSGCSVGMMYLHIPSSVNQHPSQKNLCKRSGHGCSVTYQCSSRQRSFISPLRRGRQQYLLKKLQFSGQGKTRNTGVGSCTQQKRIVKGLNILQPNTRSHGCPGAYQCYLWFFVFSSLSLERCH
jgi:hypothetical protein